MPDPASRSHANPRIQALPSGFTLVELAMVLVILALFWRRPALVPVASRLKRCDRNAAFRASARHPAAHRLRCPRYACPRRADPPALAAGSRTARPASLAREGVPWRSLAIPATDAGAATATPPPTTGRNYWRYRVDAFSGKPSAPPPHPAHACRSAITTAGASPATDSQAVAIVVDRRQPRRRQHQPRGRHPELLGRQTGRRFRRSARPGSGARC